MDSKLLSKTNMGGLATIILVILLCQARFFNFMVGTTLGRAVLVFLVLGITCAHHILGVIAVLAIIVIYNQSNVDYMEGLATLSADAKKPSDDTSMGVASAMPATMLAAKPATMPATMPPAGVQKTQPLPQKEQMMNMSTNSDDMFRALGRAPQPSYACRKARYHAYCCKAR